MSHSDRCPECGAERSAGICPRCLIRLGLDRAGPDRSRPFSSANTCGFTGDASTTPSVLDSIAASIGPIPRVLLRDTGPGEQPGPIIKPQGPDGAEPGIRYRIDGEIARGGMGAILKGRDPDLGRDVALKVLREDHRDNTDMVKRFVEEAQIGGQLQHPGVVPIYELGTFTDRRPFFSMKLVKGNTLAKLLEDRATPTDELPRLLSIYEAVCQTVAYAHARGVIHRDLKPSNVMVGSFGEVQVMDWGLAKVLPRGGVVDDAQAGKTKPIETVITTARSGEDCDPSLAGSIMGTPAYMAPEQARGEIDRIDERADVFALGSVLCEILTGEPAFLGRSPGEIQRKAAMGDTTDALARLDVATADTDLITLAKQCLAPEPEDRPRQAGTVAERVAAYLIGVQEKLRQAELDRVEERAKRRLTGVVAAAVVLLGLAGGAGYAWNQQQKAERLARTTRAVDEALADAHRIHGEALAASAGEEVARWAEALSAVARAEGLAAQSEANEQLRRGVAELRGVIERDRDDADAKAHRLAADRTLRADLDAARGRLADDRGVQRADADYAAAFRRAGLDLDATDPAQAGRWLASRSQPVELIGYLDSWSNARIASGRPEADWKRLVAIARAADPDPWRDALRARIAARDPSAAAEFRRLADDVKALDLQPAPSLNLLALLLARNPEDRERAARVLRRAVLRHPGDFVSHFNLSDIYGDGFGYVRYAYPKPEEAERHLTVAVALRPESRAARYRLANVLILLGKRDEAREVLREAIRIGPDDLQARRLRWYLLLEEQKLDEALTVIREVIRQEPNSAWNHYNLGQTLMSLKKYTEALEAHREAVRLDPGVPMFHNNVGLDLYLLGRLDEAIAATRKAIELQPGWAVAYNNLGLFLANQGKNEEALTVLRQAVRLDPEFHTACGIMGDVLRNQGDYPGAVAAYRKADAILRKQPMEMSTGFTRVWTDKIEQAERLAGLVARLPALVKGDDRPRDNAERLALAQWCYDRKLFSAATRFWGDALVADPKVGDDRVVQNRYNAACAAALAAAGAGKGEPPLDEPAKTSLRRQALDWLKAELAAWTKIVDRDPKSRNQAVLAVKHWKDDADLVSVREAASLRGCPTTSARSGRPSGPRSMP